MRYEALASGLSGRLRRLRRELFGTNGAPLLASQVGVSTREWLDFESGESLPAVVLERLVATTLVDPIWLLRGVGPCYRPGPAHRPAPADAPPDPRSDSRPAAVATLVGRRVRVPAWAELGDVQDTPPVGIICDVFDLGRGPLARVRGDGFDLHGVFALDEVELLD
ncbi:MAG TPA: hypothetical protein VG406_25925 [Isosphaeraceae bacterium]|jgi:hypothetical protein|nr:hypothetical protein [Isosphaeraceae bacterium]